jgi:hypothetical protein
VTEQEPGNYERATTAASIVASILQNFPDGEHPEGGQANTLMILAMMAQARAALAVADELRACRTVMASLGGQAAARGALSVIKSSRGDYT